MDKLSSMLLKVIFIIICLLSIFFIIKYTFIYVYPFIIALIFAYLIHPFVTYIEKKWLLKRYLATLLVIILAFISFITISFLLMKYLLDETSELIQKLFNNNDIVTTFFKITSEKTLYYYEKITTYLSFLPDLEEMQIETYITLLHEYFISSSSTVIANLIQTTTTILSSLTHFSIISIFILIIAYFITKEIPNMHQQLHEVSSIKFKLKWNQLKSQLKKSVWAFIKAQFIISFTSSVIICIGLLFIKIDHVVTIVMIIFIIDIIPYIGIGLIFIPWIIYCFIMMQYGLTIQLSVLYAFVIIIRQLIEPKILASNMGIHPFIAISILFISFQALGIIGVILTPILVIFLSALYHIRVFHFLIDYVKN